MRRMNGTSMATPLVSGVAAIMMSWEFLAGNVNAVKERLRQNSQFGWINGQDFDNYWQLPIVQSGIEFNDSLPYHMAPEQPEDHDHNLPTWDPDQIGVPGSNDVGRVKLLDYKIDVTVADEIPNSVTHAVPDPTASAL